MLGMKVAVGAYLVWAQKGRGKNDCTRISDSFIPFFINHTISEFNYFIPNHKNHKS